MLYVSTFSGIEAASVAWGPLGWEPMCFSEVAPLMARDGKGVGSQFVHDGKVLAEPGADGWTVRRLTPMECERLQGFPDGWTDVPYRGAEHPPDAPRYRALGNSMAVPVMRWIGERMEIVDGIASGAR